LGGILLIPKLRPSLRDGTGPKMMDVFVLNLVDVPAVRLNALFSGFFSQGHCLSDVPFKL
jgi:hypothetical protein